MILLPWLIMLTCIGICEICIPQDIYDKIRDMGRGSRTNGRNHYEYSCVGNAYEVSAVPLTADQKIDQMILLDENMLEDDELIVGVLFGTYSRKNRGEFCIQLSQGERQWDHQYYLEELSDMEMYHMVFPTEDMQAGELQISIWSENGSEENCAAVILAQYMGVNDRNKNDINNFRHMESTVFQKAVVNGAEQQGVLMMELYTR